MLGERPRGEEFSINFTIAKLFAEFDFEWVFHSYIVDGYYAAPFLQNRLGTKEKTTLQWGPKMAKSAMKISKKKKMLFF